MERMLFISRYLYNVVNAHTRISPDWDFLSTNGAKSPADRNRESSRDGKSFPDRSASRRRGGRASKDDSNRSPGPEIGRKRRKSLAFSMFARVIEGPRKRMEPGSRALLSAARGSLRRPLDGGRRRSKPKAGKRFAIVFDALRRTFKP